MLLQYRNTLILCSLKIIKYVQYLVCIRTQNVLQRSHIAQISDLSVLFTHFTEPFATFVLNGSLERSIGRAASLPLGNGILNRGTLLVVRKKLLAPKMSIIFSAGYSDGGEGARRPSHTITTCLVTAMCGVSSARFVTCFT